MKPTKEALKLFHDGTLAFAEIEQAGIRIDVPYLKSAIEKTTTQIKELRSELRGDKTYALWQKTYGDKTNLGSLQQKAHIVFDLLKYKHPGWTAKSYDEEGKLRPDARIKADESAFEGVDLPFIKTHNRFEELKKFKSTFLEGLLKETVDGHVHPFFHLHTVDSFRSSSSSPNFQNQPRRNAELAEVIRRAFIPSKDCRFVENDFGAHEFKIAACVYPNDKAMVSYATDKSKDIHHDMAMKIFKLPKDVDSKQLKVCRDVAKNQFTFPMLYGSFYVQIARRIWEDMEKRQLAIGNKPMRECFDGLGKCDAKERPEPGTFEWHMKEVETEFSEMFPVFWSEKDSRYQQYRRDGGFRLATGFWIERQEGGMCSKNFVLNVQVQGPAFHCLLWTIIRVMKKLRKYKMKAKVVGQIHDCGLGDVPDKELQDYLDLYAETVERHLPKAWPWVIVPLVVEAEVTDVPERGGNWWSKVNWHRDGKIWSPIKK